MEITPRVAGGGEWRGASWTTRDVEEYYYRCHKYYRWFWFTSSYPGLHYGFASQHGQSREQRQMNVYRELSKVLRPESHQHILDLGCGVGGASLWLARHHNCRCVALNIEKRQLLLTQQYSVEKNTERLITPLAMDFFRLGLRENSFDAVVAIESLSYAYGALANIYRELFSVLKPGGKLVIFDGVKLRDPATNSERLWLTSFCSGWRLPDIDSFGELLDALSAAGFEMIAYEDRSREIAADSRLIHRMAMASFLPLALLRCFGLIARAELENIGALRAQKHLLENQILGYRTVLANKPGASASRKPPLSVGRTSRKGSKDKHT